MYPVWRPLSHARRGRWGRSAAAWAQRQIAAGGPEAPPAQTKKLDAKPFDIRGARLEVTVDRAGAAAFDVRVETTCPHGQRTFTDSRVFHLPRGR